MKAVIISVNKDILSSCQIKKNLSFYSQNSKYFETVINDKCL